MINLTTKEYNKLKNDIISNEGYLFRNPENLQKIIKVISLNRETDFLKMKMKTIKLLVENYQYLKPLNIAIPETIVSIDSCPRGYQTTYFEGITLERALNNYQIPLDTRIDYLKQIGSILRDMSEIRKKYPHLNKLFYNDIHENNFIVTPKNIVYGIDLDSCSIQDNLPSSSLYASELPYINPNIKKYPLAKRENIHAANLTPSEDLDIYCYIRMIINFIYGKNIDNLTKDKLYDYLIFLEYYGANSELIECLSKIYEDDTPNTNPDYLLDSIKDIYQYSNYYFDKTGKLSKILQKRGVIL